MKFGLQYPNYIFDYRNHDSSHLLPSIPLEDNNGLTTDEYGDSFRIASLGFIFSFVQ
jgi:hypothetical protein